jgi:hypothetical protein
MAKKFTPTELDELITRAFDAGHRAGLQHTPTPMGVTDGTQRWVVESGPCGFAWVNIKPAIGQVAKALVARNLARKDSYEGGVTVWVSQFDQSWERKRAFAHAFAQVLRDAGVQARAGDRLD